MSGPITVGFVLAPGVLALTQRALEEARAMKREYGAVMDQLRAREAELARTQEASRNARLERVAAVRREATRQAARFERLQALVGELPGLEGRLPAAPPPPPPAADDAAWDEHARALAAAAEALEALLAQAGGAYAERLRESLAAGGAAASIDAVLSAYVVQRRMSAALDPAQADAFRQTAARVLGRIELAQDAEVPRELEALARAIVLAPSVERAEALASELRLGVQRHREAERVQRRESEKARRALAELPKDAPAPLLRALERVAAGVERMDEALERSAQDVLDDAAADRAKREEEAAAYVLEQSLRDLGYEVEDIEATLFCDGGVVHFRRPGWDHYFVRMRVAPREGTANFNVVRASGGEESAERYRLDALAEDRWCAEFPRLMETLAARGIALHVERRLAAGEVPVQVVEGGSLPPVHAEDAARPRRSPLARRTPE